jgi:hypothetical protein
MTFSAWRLPRRQPLAASYDDLPGCFVAMCWAGSQDGFAHSASVLRKQPQRIADGVTRSGWLALSRSGETQRSRVAHRSRAHGATLPTANLY